MNHKRTFGARKTTINIRVSPWEKSVIQARADKLGLSVSAYLLGHVFGFEEYYGSKVSK